MAGMRLIQRHELFLREYLVNGMNGQAAYRAVYGNVFSARVQASKLLAKPHVRRRYNQMLSKLIKRADITEEKVLSQYQEAYDMAKDQGKTADMVSATSAQAKLVGMLRDRIEAGIPGSFEHLENISDVLEAIAQQAGADVASKIGQALGIVGPIEAQPTKELLELAETPTVTDAVN